MSQQYNPIVIDEVMYWFDILENKSIDNIAAQCGVQRDKVRKVLDDKFALNLDIYDVMLEHEEKVM